MEKPLIKIAGRRRGLRATSKDANDFLWMIVKLRGDKPFIPKGVYRFRSFEESQRWSIKMMARRKNQGRQH
ncbi:MAG: hypothetical protein HY562_10020 [Ignavibacteriales bacterium]|nr:hypothetical protein [Ignavibacteriales bacterium]